MNQTIQLSDELLEAALLARMRHAPSQALFDRIVAGAATVPQERAPRRWLEGRFPGARVGMPALAGVVAVLIAVTLLFSVLRPNNLQPGGSASPSPEATSTRKPLGTPEVKLLGDSQALRLRLGGDTAPIGLAYAFGSIWTADFHAGAVSRINPASLEEVARIPVAGGPAWFALADNALWVTDQTGFGIVRIDQASNTAFDRVGSSAPCGAPAVVDGDIWLSACDANLYVRIDPVSNTVLDTIPAQDHRWIVAIGSELITVGPEGLATLDPATRRFGRLGAGVGAGGTLLGVGGGSVWVALNQSVDRVDPADGRVIASFPYLGAQAIAFAGAHAWLTVDNRGVLEIDLATNTVTRTIPVLPSPQVPLEAAGALWVTDYNNSAVWRIEP